MAEAGAGKTTYSISVEMREIYNEQVRQCT